VNEIAARVVCQSAAERFNDVDWRQMMLHGEAHARVLSSSTATAAEADKSMRASCWQWISLTSDAINGKQLTPV